MKAALLVVIAAILLVTVYAILVYLIPKPVETAGCKDISCIRDFEIKKDECIPSSIIIEGRDGIALMVNITREGNRCIRTETVLAAPESSYLIGHNASCESDISKAGEPESLVCPGSLYDYVKPSGGEGGGGGSSAPSPGIPEIDCGVDDDECKDLATTYLQDCINSKIKTTNLRWEPEGYWTLFFDVSRRTDFCNYYVEVLNAVNLPPGTPTTVIGSNMTCSIPYSEMPTENLTASWCSGSLFDYLYA